MGGDWVSVCVGGGVGLGECVYVGGGGGVMGERPSPLSSK